MQLYHSTLPFKSWYISYFGSLENEMCSSPEPFFDKTVWATVDSSEIQQTSHHLSVSFWKPATFVEHFPTTKWFAVFHKPGVKKNPHTWCQPKSSIKNPLLFSTITCWWFRNPAITSWGTGSLSHCLQDVYTFQVVGLRISEPSTVSRKKHKTIPRLAAEALEERRFVR